MKKLKEFFINVKAELLKVSWPTRDELLNSTSVVIISVGILALYIGAVDLFYTFIVELIVK